MVTGFITRRRPLHLILLVTLAAAGSASGQKDDPSQIGNRDVGKGINFYSIEKEMALGKQLAEEVVRQAKLVDDPIVAEYVNRIGQNLVRNSDAKFPFVFQVIESDQPNAFALPGGYVFVHTGLIKMADEEAELAGAMAHEIAHVAARHLTRQATRSQLLQLGSIPLTVLLGGWTGYGARQAANTALPMAVLSFSRRDESEADFLGVQYMYAAGYDPGGAVSLFEKLESLERKKPGTLGRLLATHPPDGVRLEKVQQQIDKLLPAREQYVVTTSAYTEVRERLFHLQDRQRAAAADDRPRLRTRPAPAGENPDSGDRPTVRRRDFVE